MLRVHGVSLSTEGKPQPNIAQAQDLVLRVDHAQLRNRLWPVSDCGTMRPVALPGDPFRSWVSIAADELTFVIARGSSFVAAAIITDGVLHWDSDRDLMENPAILRSLVIPLWLESKGVPCLHANALIDKSGGGVLLVGSAGAGKSTLSAALVLSYNYRLFSDDQCPLFRRRISQNDGSPSDEPSTLEETSGQRDLECPFVAAPGRTFLRLREPTAEWLSASTQHVWSLSDKVSTLDAKVIATQELDDSALPTWVTIRRAIVLEPVPAEGALASCLLSKLGGTEALLSFMQHGSLASAPGLLGKEGSRTQQLADFVARTPVYRLAYTPGLAQLSQMCASVHSLQAR